MSYVAYDSYRKYWTWANGPTRFVVLRYEGLHAEGDKLFFPSVMLFPKTHIKTL